MSTQTQTQLQGQATATVASWDEAPYDEVEGTPKTARARVTFTYDGDLQGEGVVEMLLGYAGQEAGYVALERFTGSVAGRSGSFLATSTGTFSGGVARTSFTVIPGSGTEQLAGLTGHGTSEAPEGNQATLTLDYDLG